MKSPSSVSQPRRADVSSFEMEQASATPKPPTQAQLEIEEVLSGQQTPEPSFVPKFRRAGLSTSEIQPRSGSSSLQPRHQTEIDLDQEVPSSQKTRSSANQFLLRSGGTLGAFLSPNVNDILMSSPSPSSPGGELAPPDLEIADSVNPKRKMSYTPTLNFMFAVVSVIGVAIFLGHGLTDEKGKTQEEIKPLEEISSYQFLSYLFVVAAAVFVIMAKGSYFGYESIIGEESARESVRRLAAEENLAKEILRVEQLTEFLNSMDLKLLNADTKRKRLLEEAAMAAGENAQIQAAIKNKLEEAAKSYDAGLAVYKTARTELKEVFQSIKKLGKVGSPPKGLDRLPPLLRYYLRFCLFMGALASAACVITGCALYFLIYKYKVDHSSHLARTSALVSIVSIGVVGFLSHIPVMVTALTGY